MQDSDFRQVTGPTGVKIWETDRKSTRFGDSEIEWTNKKWNPITGCIHGCKYCYADAMAKNPFYAKDFPKGFEPCLWTAALDAIKKPLKPNPAKNKVFVGTMSDIIGNFWIHEQIGLLLAACRDNPQWRYQYLTKNPRRYPEFADELPANACIGTTVDYGKRLANLTALSDKRLDRFTRFVSFEPMFDDMGDLDLSGIDWIIVGGQTRGKKTVFAPERQWVDKLIKQARKANCAVFTKPNLGYYQELKEYPPVLMNDVPADNGNTGETLNIFEVKPAVVTKPEPIRLTASDNKGCFQLPQGFIYSPKVPVRLKYCAIGMMSFNVNGSWYCWAALDTIANRIGCSVGSVSAWRVGLLKTPWLRNVKTKRNKGKTKAYGLQLPEFMNPENGAWVNIPRAIFDLTDANGEQLSVTKKMLLLFLYGKQEGNSVRVSQQDLAKWSCLKGKDAKKDVKRALRELQRDGHLEIILHDDEKGSQTTEYKILSIPPKHILMAKVDEPDRGVNLKVDTAIPGGKIEGNRGVNLKQGIKTDNITKGSGIVTFTDCQSLARLFKEESHSFVIHDTNLNVSLLQRFAESNKLTRQEISDWMTKALAGIAKAEQVDLSLENLLSHYTGGPMAEPTNGIGNLRVYNADYAHFKPTAPEEVEFDEYQFMSSLLGYDTGYLGEDVTLYCGAPA